MLGLSKRRETMAEEETKDTEVDENSDDQNTEGEAPKALADESENKP